MTALFGDQRLPQRFWDKARVNEVTGCWEWTAAKTDHGYGVFGRKGAHRVAFTTLRFDPGPGLECDHLCRVRNCVNPNHMRAVTKQVNVLASTAPSARNAAKTHCVKGHPFTGENLKIVNAGNGKTKRQCATCLSERATRSMQGRSGVCGTTAGYRYGCRCDACKANQRDRTRAYRAAKRAVT